MRASISRKIIIRYSLLQLPGIVFIVAGLILIQRWIILSEAIFWGVILLWLTKDFILFFYTWKAYDWEKRDLMAGKRGVALERIVNKGYVMINGERWYAVNEGPYPIEKGQEVSVLKRKGLTLFIRQ